VGDLVELNYFARILSLNEDDVSVGIIMSNARSCSLRSDGDNITYWIYDVFVGSELVTDIPQDFMKRIKIYENEENIK
jgi:2C-methyl-D-erythritol 2,4-cyclodiphosphate synthase